VIREATEADKPVLRELWREFVAYLDEPAWQQETWEAAWRDLRKQAAEGLLLLAERDGAAIAFAAGEISDSHVAQAYLSDLYVREAERGRGLGKALLGEFARRVRERGATHVTLHVAVSNPSARAVYDRLGFRPMETFMATELGTLEQRLAGPPEGETFGSVHVQTDDAERVEKAVARFVPRLGRSAGSEVSAPRNGWVAVYDELCDREPQLLQRLARELSNAIGAPALAIGMERGSVVRYGLYDRGGAVDEYLSVPEFYGPLPPGDVVALGANPTVLARLTGAEPARIRAVARTGASAAELPPARQMLGEIAAAMGIEGAGRGYGEPQ
jgi:ribosomal protein S18 acetylase RimI-like enzyme